MTTTDGEAAASENLLARIEGQRVISVYFEGSLQIDFGMEPNFKLSIESLFEFNAGSMKIRIRGTPYDPEMERLRTVVDATVISAVALGNGKLSIAFDGGQTLTCDADESFESWQINGPDGFLVVSMPAGDGLAIWGVP